MLKGHQSFDLDLSCQNNFCKKNFQGMVTLLEIRTNPPAAQPHMAQQALIQATKQSRTTMAMYFQICLFCPYFYHIQHNLNH